MVGDNPFNRLGLNFSAETELENYRASTLFTKEPETIAWIDSWGKSENSCFYDVGANIGIYSFYAVAKHHGLRVLSFEPESKNYQALCQNNLLNPKFGIETFPFAISDITGITKLAVADERVGNSNSQIELSETGLREVFSPVRYDTVLRTSIDFLVNSMRFPSPEFLKIDVDGHENAILNGAIETIKMESMKSILVEFNDLTMLEYWSSKFSLFGFELDTSFDDVYGHSTLRRQQNGATMRNVVFSRR